MKAIRRMGTLVLLLLAPLLSSCTGIPEGLAPVTGFEPERYLGTWHEIARLDHSFERGLSRVSATYSRRDDGGLKVINRGFDAAEHSWSEAEGRAYFTESSSVGALKVSFFGPFFGAYNIIALDKQDYQWVMICGNSRDTFWILARNRELGPEQLGTLLEMASAWGFATGELIFVDQSPLPAE